MGITNRVKKSKEFDHTKYLLDCLESVLRLKIEIFKEKELLLVLNIFI